MTIHDFDMARFVAGSDVTEVYAKGDVLVDPAIGARGLTGVFYCCGTDGIGRMDLARLACDVFGLDPGLLRSGPPDPDALPDAPIPYDTTITSPRTSELPGRSPTPIRRLLEGFHDEYRGGS